MRIFPENLCSALDLRFGGEGLIGDEDERPKGSHVPSTASKLIYTFNRVITIAVLLLLQCLATVHGSWIDPSTPEGFHSILVPHPHQYFAPRHPKKEKKKVPESGSPTESPTESPTMQPTPMPPFHSKAPTQSPTYAPTATPTPDVKVREQQAAAVGPATVDSYCWQLLLGSHQLCRCHCLCLSLSLSLSLSTLYS